MSWKKITATIACFTACSTAYATTITTGLELYTNLEANTPSITFGNSITQFGFYPVNVHTDLTPNNITTNIIGGPGISLNGSGSLRGFFVGGGNLVITGLIITNCNATGGTGGVGGGGGGLGAGGAIYLDNGTVTLNGCTIESCVAVGGTGGAAGTQGGGGGGGGLVGDGNSMDESGGGGGGGIGFMGGSGVSDGGGGGGGFGGPGANGSNSGGNGGTNFAGNPGGIGGAAGVQGDGATFSGTGGGGGGSDAAPNGTSYGGDGELGGGGGGSGGQALANSTTTIGVGGTGGAYGGSGGGGVCASSSGAQCHGGPGGSAGINSFGGGGGGGGGIAGGGGGSTAGSGGIGAFGGGGGGGGIATSGTVGTGGAEGFGANPGTNGTNITSGTGGNGASLGGAIFIRSGTVVLQNSIVFAGNGAVTGTDIFMHSGSNLTFNLSTNFNLGTAIAGDSANQGGGGTGGQVTINNMSPSVIVNFGANANTFLGTTVIQNGIFEISTDGVLGSSALALNNGLTFNTSTGGSPTLLVNTLLTVTIGASRPITFNGTGTSTITVPTGTLVVPNSFALSGTLNLNPTSTAIFSGVISGGGALTMLGTGVSTLEGLTANSYTGLTTVSAGILDLDKTTGPAVVGDISITGGTLRLLTAGGALGQIGPASNMTISGGIFDMNAVAANMNSLTFNAGTITNQTDDLTLLSAATALTMADGTTIPGTGDLNLTHGGGVTFSPTAAGVATISAPVNLEGNNVTFTVNPGTGPSAMMVVNSAISNGMITLAGTGTLQFAGATANTYTGTTTINSGTLELDKTAPGTNAIPGDVMISGGTLLLQNSEQIADSSNMTINSGTFAMGSFDETINSLTYLGGSLTQAGGTLSLFNAGTALTMQGGLTIPTSGTGTLILSNGGNVFGPTNGGTATIADTVTIGTPGNNVWNLTLGTNPFDMIVSGNLTGTGNLTVAGTGVLNLAGPASNIAGPTIVSGTSTLAVNGSFTTPSITVDPGATLHGTGTIIGNVNVQGFISPGNSIGNLTIDGTVTFAAGSTYINEITPTTTDLLTINGTLTIDPGASFELEPVVGIYPNTNRLVISTTGGVTGKFTNFSEVPFIFKTQLTYTANDVFLGISLNQLATLVPAGNGQNVATAIDQIFATGNTQDPIFAALANVPLSELNFALNQMQSSLFTAMTVVQQSNAVLVTHSLGHRFQNVLDFSNCISKEHCPEKPATHMNGTTNEAGETTNEMHKTMTTNSEKECNSCKPENEFAHLWVDGFGDFTHQQKNTSSFSPQRAYGSSTTGVVSGIDLNFVDYLYVGALGAYTRSNVDWSHRQAKAHINSSYAGLYASGISKMFYGNVSVIRSWNHVGADRKIVFTGTDKTAKSQRDGNQVISHGDTGVNFGFGNFSLRPFDSFDYITQQEGSYKETGADGFSLDVLGRTLRMYRNELGLNFARCFCSNSDKLVIDVKMSWIYEGRIKGKDTTARFSGTSPHFTVTNSDFRNQNLFSTGLTLTYKLHNTLDATAYYNGEFGRRYWDQSFGLQIGYDF